VLRYNTAESDWEASISIFIWLVGAITIVIAAALNQTPVEFAPYTVMGAPVKPYMSLEILAGGFISLLLIDTLATGWLRKHIENRRLQQAMSTHSVNPDQAR
jgi:hypothetical protein